MRNFKTNLKKILKYAKSINTKIIFKNVVSGGGQLVMSKTSHHKVYVEKGISEELIISTILHELGHIIEASMNPSEASSTAYLSAMAAMLQLDKRTKLTAERKEVILRVERDAWKYGVAIARQLRIPLGNWFYADMKKSLGTYYYQIRAYNKRQKFSKLKR